MKNSLTAFFIISLLTICSAQENSVLREQCGGAIKSDSSSLIFPGNSESIQQGEVCVWTIILETTRDFRINFRHYDTNSTDCSEGGVRIYALSNLVTADNIESYEFCASSPAPDDFFLSGTAAVVIFYSSANNTNPGWFGLSWSGNSFDPLGTTHVSSFSTATSGAIQYPVVGHYEPNLVATWNVDASQSLQASGIDFNLKSLRLDTCTNTDPCTCDALILYEISDSAHLNESRRVCNDVTNINLLDIENRFILAFFTDATSSNSSETGFEALYFPNDSPTTTSTTTESPNEDTPCGTVIRAESGTISYKNGTAHGMNERCVWIIEIPNSFMVNFELLSGDYYWSSGSHAVQVTTFRRSNNGLSIQNEELIYYGHNRILEAEIAVVTFYSRGTVEGEGFVLAFERVLDTPTTFVGNHLVLSESPTAHLQYPENGTYRGLELSAFVYSPETIEYEAEFDSIKANLTVISLDDTCNCCDYIEVYAFSFALGYQFVDKICTGSNLRYYNDDALLFFLVSDNNGSAGRGFSVDFSVQ